MRRINSRYYFTRRVYEAYKNVDRPRANHSKIVREMERTDTRARYNRDELYLLTDLLVQLDFVYVYVPTIFFYSLLFKSVHFLYHINNRFISFLKHCTRYYRVRKIEANL